MTVSQSEFRAALLDSAMPPPEGLRDAGGGPAGRRFDVYRNNVAVSLTEALESGFPVIRKLLGDENFRAIAGVYLREHPPQSPMMMLYGQGFDGFLRGFEPLQHLGYLGDVAALEMELRHAYHAADAPALAPDALARVPATDLDALRLTLAPAVRLVVSDWPIHDIWAYNLIEGAPKPRAEAQDVLILRPEFDPHPHLLPAGGAGFVTALNDGHSLAKAADMASADAPGFDLGACLALLLGGGAITSITT